MVFVVEWELVLSVFGAGSGVLSPRMESDALQSGCGWSPWVLDCRLSCREGVALVWICLCAFDALDVCRASDSVSAAARPNDPAVSKEADRTAVMGSHLFGSMWKGLGRKLIDCVSEDGERVMVAGAHGDSISGFRIEASIKVAAALFESLILVRLLLYVHAAAWSKRT